VFPDAVVGLGLGGVGEEDLAVKAAEGDDVLEEGDVGGVDGVVGEEGWGHVHEIGPMWHQWKERKNEWVRDEFE
jgi:hypothetical protein